MRGVCAFAIFLAALGCGAQRAAAAEAWHSQQPLAPGIETPAEIGEVGDIEFWAPNRGVLITAGNLGVPAGIFAYDGTGWYRYATVCGGRQGRIVWAGPDEFWTISDPQKGQETAREPKSHTSLCHFKNGEVVASYAEPEGVAGSYLPMNAAACSGPTDCWFAGEDLPGTVNQGAFHLHWDGSSLTAVPSLTDFQPAIVDPGHEVTGLAFHEGGLYEGVRIQEREYYPPEEDESEPFFFHRIMPTGPNPFATIATAARLSYGDEGATSEQLEGFKLSASGGSLWAASGAATGPARMTVVRKKAAGAFAQIPLSDPESILEPGDHLGALAAESEESAWIGFRRNPEGPAPGESASNPARLIRVHADGTLDPEISLPRPEEGIGRKGPVAALACPGAEQCWMATSRGWLFHLGSDPAPNDDPAMHTVIGFRPRDDSLPSVPPIGLPEDTSGASSPYEYTGAGEEPEHERKRPRAPRRRALLVGVHQKLIGGRVLLFTFTLRAKAHVKIVAKRHRQVVAETKRHTMGRGHRSLRLRLDPKRWPTSLDFQVHEVKGGKK